MTRRVCRIAALSFAGVLLLSVQVAAFTRGDIFVSSRSIELVESIVRIDPNSGDQSLVSSGQFFYGLMDLAIDPGGSIYAVTQRLPGGGYGAVLRVDPSTGAQSIVASGGSLRRPTGILLEPGGSLLIADIGSGADPGRLVRVNPATGAQSIVSSCLDLSQPVAAATGPAGDEFIADFPAGPTPGSVRVIEHETGACSTLTSGIWAVRLAADSMGHLYFAQTTHVGVIDVSSGTITGSFEDSRFLGLMGVAVETTGQVVTVDNEADALFRIDPASGQAVLLSSSGYIRRPTCVAVWTDAIVPGKTTSWGSIKASYR